jgi:signal transduction histidine kinase
MTFINRIRQSLSLQVFTGIFGIAIITFLSLLIVTQGAQRIQGIFRDIDSFYHIAEDLSAMTSALYAGHATLATQRTSDPLPIQNFRDSQTRFDKIYKELLLELNTLTPADQNRFKVIGESWEAYGKVTQQFLDALTQSQPSEASRWWGELSKQVTQLDQTMSNLIDFVERDYEDVHEAEFELLVTNAQNFRIYGVGILSIVLFVLLQNLITRNVRELRRLTDGFERYGRGEYGLRLTSSFKNEIGRLTTIFNQMASQIQQRESELIRTVQTANEARTTAEKAEQAKTFFLATMSHELRTPLNGIINFSKLVSRGEMGDINEDQVEALKTVSDNGEHLLSIVNDILDISKVEAGSLKLLVQEDVPLQALVEHALKIGGTLLSDKPEVTLEGVVLDPLPTMRGDRKRILQILLNLLSNACKFTKTGTVRLIVDHQMDTDSVLFKVEDTGVGIDPAEVSDLFVPFRQGKAGRLSGVGTGLGLPIVKSLVDAHGGRIWVESTVGKGTTFFVELPLHAEKLKQTS